MGRAYFKKSQVDKPEPDGDILRAWLVGHPEVWHGWPSVAYIDPQERMRLERRLRTCGCTAGTSSVTEAVAQIRADHKRAYVQATSATAIVTEGFGRVR
jgi:hypothetical protein